VREEEGIMARCLKRKANLKLELQKLSLRKKRKRPSVFGEKGSLGRGKKGGGDSWLRRPTGMPMEKKA